MAIQLATNKQVFGQTLEFEDAYYMISLLNGNKDRMLIQLTVYNNSSKEYIIEDGLLFEFTPSILDDAHNFYKQAYTFLKTLETFTGAIDVLEEGQVV